MFISNIILLNFTVKRKNELWTWIFGIIAFVYNPILTIHLNRMIWSVINILTIIIYLISILKKREK